MADPMVIHVKELKNWMRSAGVPGDAEIRLNVGGHVGVATGWALGWASDDAGQNVLVLTADEERD